MPAEHKPYVNRIQRRVKDDEELRLLAGKVASTINTEGWQILMSLVDEAHADATRNLLLGQTAISGQIPSQAEYARAVGFLAGVKQPQVAAEAFDLALTAMRRANESPE